MKRAIEQLREYARRENAAYKRLENAGYMCWWCSKCLAREVVIERYESGKNGKADFPKKR